MSAFAQIELLEFPLSLSLSLSPATLDHVFAMKLLIFMRWMIYLK